MPKNAQNLHQPTYSHLLPELDAEPLSNDFGAGLLSEKGYSLANWILVFREPYCQGLVNDRHTASFCTVGRNKVATSQQLNTHGLKVLGRNTQYVDQVSCRFCLTRGALDRGWC